MLVAAVLRPEEREDGELEVVRLALEQRDDTGELPVREAELAVEWLFHDGAQAVSLTAARDDLLLPTAFASSAATAGTSARAITRPTSRAVSATVPNGSCAQGR